MPSHPQPGMWLSCLPFVSQSLLKENISVKEILLYKRNSLLKKSFSLSTFICANAVVITLSEEFMTQ